MNAGDRVIVVKPGAYNARIGTVVARDRGFATVDFGKPWAPTLPAVK